MPSNETLSPKEQAEFIRRLKKNTKQWLEEDKIEFEELEDPNTEIKLSVNYHDTKIDLIRPKGRKAVMIALGVNLSPEHQAEFVNLPQSKKRELIHILRSTAFQGGLVGFGPTVESEIYTRWVLDYTIYDDAISRNSLLTAFRQLFTKHLELVGVLSFYLETGKAGTSSSTLTTGYV